jgi:hypothetical protein
MPICKESAEQPSIIVEIALKAQRKASDKQVIRSLKRTETAEEQERVRCS